MEYAITFAAGVLVGGFLAYEFAGKIVSLAVTEYQKAESLVGRVKKAL